METICVSYHKKMEKKDLVASWLWNPSDDS